MSRARYTGGGTVAEGTKLERIEKHPPGGSLISFGQNRGGSLATATAVVDVVAAVSTGGGGGGRHGVEQLDARCWRTTAQRQFAEAVVGVGDSGDGGCDSGGGGDVGGGEGVGCEVAGCSAAAAAVVVTVFAVTGGMAASVD
ncbi:hypothetical protein [Oryza sativa Japonica Group]|uniref:Uncharacterized protein n=1 Tax=Oryza sativa subsp. japonica TaxID=39947 RepID=Q5QNG1_ORYSJ|nr:hypothetical protein [Oryza sativa Japonica Group]BAD73044.1 hypothetical protein [Oryza sativa Japonica Group]